MRCARSRGLFRQSSPPALRRAASLLRSNAIEVISAAARFQSNPPYRSLGSLPDCSAMVSRAACCLPPMSSIDSSCRECRAIRRASSGDCCRCRARQHKASSEFGPIDTFAACEGQCVDDTLIIDRRMSPRRIHFRIDEAHIEHGIVSDQFCAVDEIEEIMEGCRRKAACPKAVHC